MQKAYGYKKIYFAAHPVGKSLLRERLGNYITNACDLSCTTGTRRLPGGGSSVVEDRQVQLTQACRIGNRGNRGDLASPDQKFADSE